MKSKTNGMLVEKSKPKRSECKCIEQVDKLLEDRNAKIARELMLSFSNKSASMSPPSVRLTKKDDKKRSSLPTLFCMYCPFCGKKYST